jgi:taurine dioxygenase
VVIWDNRCTMHKASPDYGDHRRRMARILVEGSVPF